jgi:hypothetical protein
LLIAAGSGAGRASQDEQELKKEMTAKAVEKARQKALDWLKLHPQLILRRSPVN